MRLARVVTKNVRLLVVVISVVVLSGCATRRGHFASRFVRQGEPTASYDARDTLSPTENLSDWSRRLQHLQANARAKSSMLPTIESQDRDLAAALLRLSLEETAENHRLVAVAYRRIGVRDYAFRHYQRALRLDPCDSGAHEGLGRLWRDWGRPDVALGDVYRAIHCAPHSVSAHNTLGTVLMMLGQTKNARRAFEFVLRLDDRAAFALNNLCYLSLQENMGSAAQAACERALVLDPNMVAARTNLALSYAIQGDFERAEARLLDSPDPAEAQYNVGILRMSMGQYGAAATAFERAVQEQPSLLRARRRAEQARKLAAAKKDN